MASSSHNVRLEPALVAALAGVLAIGLLSGCAIPTENFPTLERRAIEDLPVDDQPLAKRNMVTDSAEMPARVQQAIADQLDAARQANSGFEAGLATARRAVLAAQDAGQDTEDWIVAQSELSALATYSDRAATALTALDTLYVRESEAQYERDSIYDLSALVSAQSEIQDIVAEQRRILAALDGRLR